MNVFVSGVAARAVFVEEQRLSYVDADNPDQIHRAPLSSLGLLLADAPDTIEFSNIDHTEALAHLNALWSNDRALRLLQMLQADDIDSTDASYACEYLDELLESEDVYRWVLSYALAIPALGKSNIDRVAPLSNAWRRSCELVSVVNKTQPSVEHIRLSWDSISDDLFLSNKHRAVFEKAAIEKGVFKDLVLAHGNEKRVNDAILGAYIALASERNSRTIIKAWEANIGFLKERSKLDKISVEREYNEENTELEIADYHSKEQYDKVRRTQQGIIERLKRDDILHAKRFAAELIKEQLKTGGPIYAVKTLCLLAQEAKHLGFYGLALDWSLAATEVAKDDSWAWGQAGDAYLNLHRFEDADRCYINTSLLGDKHFGRMGHARVLKATYKLQEALAEFKAIKEEFPTHSEAHRAYSGIGEVLRDMSRFDEALAIYNDALKQFHNESVLWTGKAATLKDLGQLDLALETYEAAITRFPNDLYPWAGSADVLRLLGNFDAAIQRYDEVIRRFPGEAIGFTGRAEVLRERGEIERSRREYEAAAQKFPHCPPAFSGYAEALRDAGRLPQAKEAYDDAVKRFPYEPQLRVGRASLLKFMGSLELSLMAYDQATLDFPFNLYAKSGRARILKELGRYDLALSAFDDIIALRPDYNSAKHQKAALLAIRGRFAEAEALLPNTSPRTRDEWIAYHVKGMIYLRSGKHDAARTIFTTGLIRNEFARERRYFQNALAVMELAQGNYREAFSHTHEGSGVVAKILTFHSAAALGRHADAERRFDELVVDERPNVVKISKEIGARYGVNHARIQHDEYWLADKEIEIALAIAA